MNIPYSVDYLTIEWITDALRFSGVIRNSSVTFFYKERLDTGLGFTGEITRLRLNYDFFEEDSPVSLIIKLPAIDSKIRENVNKRRGYETEVSFYKEIAGQFAVSTPRCYYADTDLQSGDHVLLLEDLGANRVGNTLTGCSYEDALLAIREIAKLHVHFWDNPLSDQFTWMTSIDDDAQYQEESYQALWDPFLSKVNGIASDNLVRVGSWFREHVAIVKRKLCARPRTVVHGDFRLDNMIFGSPCLPDRFNLIDWQGVAKGRGVNDVAYLMVFGMAPELRKDKERKLLEVYHSCLIKSGIIGYTFNDCVYDYRLSLLNHLDRIVGATVRFDFLSTPAGRKFVETVLHRFDSALKDNQVTDLDF